MENFNDIIELYLEKNANIRVNSSGIIYSDSIFKGIKSGNLKLVVSIDSGTRDLYYKIKRVDRFDVLVSNLRKYASVITEKNKNCLALKYIILPGINDSIEAIDNWLDLLKDIGIHSIILDLENRYAGECGVPPDYIFYLEDYIQNYAKKNGISFDLNIFLLWANRKRTIPLYLFENFDKQKFSAFSDFIEEEKKKHLHKNIQYDI